MTEIAAHLIKELREKTGVGVLDCKKALNEVEGNLEEAVNWLRKKGLAAAAKKSGRVTAEGLIGLIAQDTWGAILEVNSETDFVGRNEQFQKFVAMLLKIVADQKISTTSTLMQTVLSTGKTVEDELSLQIATIGESLSIRRLQTLQISQGVVASYIHGLLGPCVGKIGVLVSLESSAPLESLQELGRQIAMHVAATKPLFLRTTDVDATSLMREREIFLEQAKASGRPEAVIEKMVEGRLRKYFEEAVLEEQIFVLDNKTKITDVIQQRSKILGHPIRLAGFIRMELGEGIEKTQTDFAADVHAQLQE